MLEKIKKMKPEKIIALGFSSLIITGAFLLSLSFTHQPGKKIPFIDALFTSTSSVCITGLLSIETLEYFNIFGKSLITILIQFGGLGVTSVGAAVILMTQKQMGLRSRILIKEGLNFHSLEGCVRLVKAVLKLTLLFEAIGILLSFFVFLRDFVPIKAFKIAVFHAISSFNNAGLDILGGSNNLTSYKNNILLNIITCVLIIFGGLGFCVIEEVFEKKKWSKFSMNTKIVIKMTILLLFVGTVLLKLCEKITWLGAFFHSTSARTAGFYTYNLGSFTNPGLFVLIILMFIGASPGSTGGGIKTTTAYTIFKAIYSVARNKTCIAFNRKIPTESIIDAFVLICLALSFICLNTWLICIIEKGFSFIQILFEVVSAFGTVGLSTGITHQLTDISKFILCLTMFFGRLGPLTIAALLSSSEIATNISYAEEKITIG